jgi:hypothetical protein
MKDEEMKATKEGGRMAKEASLIGQHDGYSTGVTPRFAARRKEAPSRASFNCSIYHNACSFSLNNCMRSAFLYSGTTQRQSEAVRLL